MKIGEWIDCWEALVPPALQEDWDNTGFQIGRRDKELQGVLYSLDLTEDAIRQAEARACNLIFTHHPVFFHDLHSLTDQNLAGQLALACAEKGIAVYSSHTAFDSVNGGVNDTLADLLGLQKRQALEKVSFDDPLHIYTKGMGRIGYIEEKSLRQLAGEVKEKLGLKDLIYYGPDTKKIHRLALVSGSGMDYVDLAIEQGAQLFITGDIKYHDSLDALNAGIALIDPGHYGSEFPAMLTAKKWSTTIAPHVRHYLVAHPSDLLRKVVG